MKKYILQMIDWYACLLLGSSGLILLLSPVLGSIFLSLSAVSLISRSIVTYKFGNLLHSES